VAGLESDRRDSAVDHDRHFKELLSTFFGEFLALFFPAVHAALEVDSFEFLQQETFADLLEGDVLVPDIVVKARYKGRDAFFLIHVEHQSSAPANMDWRMYRYWAVLFLRYGLPIYPIVVYSHRVPRKRQAGRYCVELADLTVLTFRYRVLQLSRMPWRRFLRSHNPVAAALMAKMDIAEQDRPRVKLECLRILASLRLDQAKTRLVSRFVDAYLSLDAVEELVFQRSIGRTPMQPEVRERVMEFITSWERRGLEKGLEQGREQGREQGQIEALRTGVREVYVARFGSAHTALADHLLRIKSGKDLLALMRKVSTAPTAEAAERAIVARASQSARRNARPS
jgi:hypothetical protein